MRMPKGKKLGKPNHPQSLPEIVVSQTSWGVLLIEGCGFGDSDLVAVTENSSNHYEAPFSLSGSCGSATVDTNDPDNPYEAGYIYKFSCYLKDSHGNIASQRATGIVFKKLELTNPYA